MFAPNPAPGRSAPRFRGAAGLPRLPDHLLDALVSIARAGGQVPRHVLHHQTLASLLDRHLVASGGRDMVELTPLGLRVLAGVGLERIRQQAAARRCRLPTDARGRVRLLVAVSALLSDLQLHQTATTTARVQAILRRDEQDPIP
jgi:hypothetical protein